MEAERGEGGGGGGGWMLYSFAGRPARHGQLGLSEKPPPTPPPGRHLLLSLYPQRLQPMCPPPRPPPPPQGYLLPTLLASKQVSLASP